MYVNAHTHTHTHTHTYIYIHTYIHTHIYTNSPRILAYLGCVLVSKETYNRPKETYLYGKRGLSTIAYLSCAYASASKEPTIWQKRPIIRQKRPINNSIPELLLLLFPLLYKQQPMYLRLLCQEISSISAKILKTSAPCMCPYMYTYLIHQRKHSQNISAPWCTHKTTTI